MNRPSWVFVAVLTLVSVSSPAQNLTCPSGAGVAGADCGIVHYHVQVWNPDNKRATELYGLNRFSSTEACESRRQIEIRENATVIALLLRLDPRFQARPDQYGPCHCDMTDSSANAYHLADEQRIQQIRLAEEARQAMRNELVRRKVPSDSPEVRSLASAPSSFAPEIWPKFIPPPPTGSDHRLSDAPTRETRTIEGTGARPTIAANLKLVEVAIPEAGSTGTTGEFAEVAADASTPADEFVAREMGRIEWILSQSRELDDSATQQQIFESMMQRVQFLSNLKRLIVLSPPSSSVAEAIATATDERRALDLIRTFLGPMVANHWAPPNVPDVVFDLAPEIVSDPVAVLRDSAGRFSEEQKKAALYRVLATTPALTSSEQLWLLEILETSASAVPGRSASR